MLNTRLRTDPIAQKLQQATSALGALPNATIAGQVTGISGMMVEIGGLSAHCAIGDRIELRLSDQPAIMAEIIGFQHGRARTLAFSALDGVGPGCVAALKMSRHGASHVGSLCPANAWLGRVIDPLGTPLDGRGPLINGPPRPVRTSPPLAAARARLGARGSLGLRAVDLFTTCRKGQRLGIFSGSGVGKSTLISMMARQADCDVAVVALVGERGREVREFIEDDLGASGLARSVLVIATSDQPPLMRREAAYAAMAVAEFFRDQGKSVLLMMDSVTRFCLALREIGIAAGEAPATRGYPPSVFAELPRLLERAGPGPERGSATGHITGLFSVLVEGDDHNEPVADAVRGILDGHIVLDRRIGEGGRYPAMDVLRSLSRTVPGCLQTDEAALVQRARGILAIQAELADLVRLGAYVPGQDPAADDALRLAPAIEAVLRQAKDENSTIETAFAALQHALEVTHAA